MQQTNIERMYIMLYPKNGSASGHARLSQKGVRSAISINLSNLKKLSAPYRALLISKRPASAIIDLGTLALSAQGQGKLTQDMFTLPTGVTLNDFHSLIICSDWPDPKVYSAGALSGNTLMPLWQMEEAARAYLLVPPKEAAKPPEPEPAQAPVYTTVPAYQQEQVPPPAALYAPEMAREPDLAEEPEATPEPVFEPAASRTPNPSNAPPIDGLQPVYWPRPVSDLKVYFDTLPPFAPFDAPGWRFVKVSLPGRSPAPFCAVGIKVQGHTVSEVAYALPGRQGTLPPPGLKGYRWQMGRQGQGYWTLWQAISQ